MKTVFILQERKKMCMYKKENKNRVEYLQKGLQLFTKYLQCPLDHSVLHLYTIKNVHTSTVFFMVPPHSLTPPPSLPWPGCGGSIGRSPASKNPNGPSGTCTAGDSPVL